MWWRCKEDLMPTLLEPTEFTAALESLDGWDGDTNSISRTLHIGDDAAMSEFLATLEKIAREMDHDPDTTISEHDLTITMSTHSAGGVTELDVEYASRVNALVNN
jgi:4a-hydroxytetrahydrobiopterin dehydratase